jgi:hypothetical protein
MPTEKNVPTPGGETFDFDLAAEDFSSSMADTLGPIVDQSLRAEEVFDYPELNARGTYGQWAGQPNDTAPDKS